MTATKRFRITIDVDETLSLSDLWPDGDAPDNPTEADVEALIMKSGGVRGILRGWNLDYHAKLMVREDKDR